MPEPLSQVTAYLDVDQELYHTSYVYTGLEELARDGRIALEIRTPAPDSWRKADPGDVCVHVEIQAGSGKRRAACIDLWDRSDRLSTRSLERVDVYFKRSYFEPHLTHLQRSQRTKIRPFGLNFSCSRTSWLPTLIRAGLGQWGIGKASRLAREAYHYWRLRRTTDFLCSTGATKEAVVLFQTRAWSSEECVPEASEVINEERACILRALRSAFGPRFLGGFIPNRIARERYPDLLTTLDTTPAGYARLNRTSLIGVYTRGLHSSTAWKLPEYFAASMCVVGEPIRNALPQPLTEGREYVTCRTPDDYVRACEDILSDEARQQRQRAAASAYYSHWVEPANHMAWIIASVSAPASAPQQFAHPLG